MGKGSSSTQSQKTAMSFKNGEFSIEIDIQVNNIQFYILPTSTECAWDCDLITLACSVAFWLKPYFEHELSKNVAHCRSNQKWSPKSNSIWTQSRKVFLPHFFSNNMLVVLYKLVLLFTPCTSLVMNHIFLVPLHLALHKKRRIMGSFA